MKKTVLFAFVMILSTAVVVKSIRPTVAESTIYIKSDGSVVGTDKIQRYGNLYIFTGNIYDPIGVERSNIIIDGAGYTSEGTGAMNGLILLRISNVTIRNINIKSYSSGILLVLTSNCTIHRNNITNNFIGIHFPNSSNYNTISENNIEDNGAGIWLDNFSNHNTIFGNNIANNIYGISFVVSLYNTIYANNLANNNFGVWLHPSSSNNKFYHNYFVDNVQQVYIPLENHDHNNHPSLTNVWDDGYSSGGNYWSDYTDVDEYSGPNQDQPGSDGIWDHPYVIDENNQDNYPLVPEFPTWTSIILILIVLTVAVAIYKRRPIKQF